MIALNIICWNCKGVNNINTFNRIWEIMKTHDPCIFCLVETKDCKNRISNVCHKFMSNWDWIDPIYWIFKTYHCPLMMPNWLNYFLC